MTSIYYYYDMFCIQYVLYLPCVCMASVIIDSVLCCYDNIYEYTIKLHVITS